MSIDVNKLRTTSASVSAYGGFVATNVTGGEQVKYQQAPSAVGGINDEALNPVGKKISSISGSALRVQRDGSQGPSGAYQGPDVQKLRAGASAVEGVGGFVTTPTTGLSLDKQRIPQAK